MASLLRELAADLACLARTAGVGAVVRKLQQGIADSVGAGEELIVIEKRLDEIAGITFDRRLRVEDLDARSLPALAEFNRRRCDTRATRRFAADLERGFRGFVAYRGDDVAGYYWWVGGRSRPRHPHLLPLGLELGDDEAYGFDFFLAEEHRGDGHAVEFLHEVETRLRALGYQTLWGYVRSDNRPARWLYSMRGYEPSKTVRVRPARMR